MRCVLFSLLAARSWGVERRPLLESHGVPGARCRGGSGLAELGRRSGKLGVQPRHTGQPQAVPGLVLLLPGRIGRLCELRPGYFCGKAAP